MKAALNILFWEIFKKNRIVFPALGALLGIGAAMIFVKRFGAPDSVFASSATRVTILCFLISLLVAFTPFTLMESSGGWRMNSMITRWFTLPVRTGFLVYVPLAAACLVISLLIGVWMLVLNFIAPGLDGVYLAAVLVAAQILFNAVAWTVPRKPQQFWIALAAAFPVVLLLALVPQDSQRHEQFRVGMLIPLSGICALLLVYTYFAARRNRCGAWPGEIPALRWPSFRKASARCENARPYRSASWALFSLNSKPTLKLLAIAWSALVLAMYLYASIVTKDSHPELSFNWRILAMVGMGVLPVFAMPLLALWGLFAAGEPASAFRTRLSSFRACMPTSSGNFAGDKILMLASGWLIVWAPLVALSYFYTPAVLGIETENMVVMQRFLARMMVISAFILAGALPLYLWGRFEGFPNILLAGVCSWAVAWAVGATFNPDADRAGIAIWGALGGLLALKIGAASYAFAQAMRQGHTTWKFPLFLTGGWLLACVLLIFVLPIFKMGGHWDALCVVLLMPLARLAWCPLAVASNRHR